MSQRRKRWRRKNNDSLEEDLLVLRSPTLRELLQYEINADLHDGKLPRLKEKSAVWVYCVSEDSFIIN